MADGQPGYLKYRVLDPNSGAVVIDDLPHLHQSSWTVRALQKGFPAAAQIGDFNVPLPPPGSDLHRVNRGLYDKLAEGQKVEAFLGDVIAGTPRFTGVITKLTKNVKDPWVIEGNDTLWWLQQSQTFPGEGVQQTKGSGIVGSFLGTEEIVWSDRFDSASAFTANYTNSGAFSQNGSDPYFGLPNVQVGGTGANLVSVTTWGQAAQFLNAIVSLRGTVVCGTATTNAGNFGIWLAADSTAANGILVNVEIDSTAGVAPYSAHLRIWSVAASVFTLRAQQTNVLTGLNAAFQFELQAVINNDVNLLQQNVRAILNGKDPGCVFSTATLTTFGGVTPGGIGIRNGPAAGGSPTLYVNNLQFEARTSAPASGGGYSTSFGTNRFAAGTITTSSLTNIIQNVSLAGQSYLDCMMLASMVDGFFLRKNPGFGFKADSIDYGPSPGTDRSDAVVFDPSNIIDGFVGPVPDLYATNVKFNAVRGSDSGGTVTWPRIGSIGDLVLRDTTQDVGVPGFRWAMLYAQQVQARKVSPSAATQLEVVRQPGIADRWRELDTVMVNDWRLGINQQKSLVMGYTFQEGSPTQTVYLSQFSAKALPRAPLWFTAGAVEWIGGIYAPR